MPLATYSIQQYVLAALQGLPPAAATKLCSANHRISCIYINEYKTSSDWLRWKGSHLTSPSVPQPIRGYLVFLWMAEQSSQPESILIWEWERKSLHCVLYIADRVYIALTAESSISKGNGLWGPNKRFKVKIKPALPGSLYTRGGDTNHLLCTALCSTVRAGEK